MFTTTLHTSPRHSSITAGRRLVALLLFVPAVAPATAFADQPESERIVLAVNTSGRSEVSAEPATARPVERPLEGRLSCLLCERPWFLGARLGDMLEGGHTRWQSSVVPGVWVPPLIPVKPLIPVPASFLSSAAVTALPGYRSLLDATSAQPADLVLPNQLVVPPSSLFPEPVNTRPANTRPTNCVYARKPFNGSCEEPIIFRVDF